MSPAQTVILVMAELIELANFPAASYTPPDSAAQSLDSVDRLFLSTRL